MHPVTMKLPATSPPAAEEWQNGKKEPATQQPTAEKTLPQERDSKATPSEDSEHHEELAILDQLGLTDSPQAPLELKELLLDSSSDSNASLKQLSDCLKRDIEEGQGECIFALGEEENGQAMGFTRAQWDVALKRLTAAAQQVGATCRVLLTYNVGGDAESEAPDTAPGGACHGKVLIREVPKSPETIIEVRIAAIGNADAGKSTLLGVLVRGSLDDGQGRARQIVTHHKHELQSGQTSSVGLEILGHDSRGEAIGYGQNRQATWAKIMRKATKMISFYDLAGHARYMGVTIFGMLSRRPNYCFFMVAANNGLLGTSKEHLGLALSLNIPVMVVITKVDVCPPDVLQQTITQLTRILKSPGAHKVPVFIDSRESCVNTATQFVNQRICPIFQVSNVTGQSLDLVRLFLDILPHHDKSKSDAPFRLVVNQTCSVPSVGTVIAGVVDSGVIRVGEEVVVGPDHSNRFLTTTIGSMQRNQTPVKFVAAGQNAGLALENISRKQLQHGMVMVRKMDQTPLLHQRFVAEVLVFSQTTTVKLKYNASVHLGAIQQACQVIALDRELVRSGDRALVGFEFMMHPQAVTPGEWMVLREARPKMLGIVKSVGHDCYKSLPVSLYPKGE